MRRTSRIAVALTVVALALASCSLSSGGGSGPSEPAVSIPPAARPAVDASTNALASQLGVDASTVSVVSVEAKDWPDTSLGCPEPGMMYGQMMTPGYAVILEAQGKTYRYHTDASGQQAVTCGS
jgi:hypothetical protein